MSAGSTSPERAEGAPEDAHADTASLVRKSWARLAGREDAVVQLFYDRLFELDPELRALFAATDMGHLRAKFADTVRMLLNVVEEPGAVNDLAHRSGERHAVYGVRDRDYRTGGEAFLWALSESLGPDFTPAVRAAWAEAYTRLAFSMARAGR